MTVLYIDPSGWGDLLANGCGHCVGGRQSELMVSYSQPLVSFSHILRGVREIPASWSRAIEDGDPVYTEMRCTYCGVIYLPTPLKNPEPEPEPVRSRVFDQAQVLDSACVLDSARAEGRATVSGRAIVSEQAIISGDARMGDDTILSGKAGLGHGARMSEHARMHGTAWVGGGAQLSGSCLIQGNARITDSVIVTGCARVEGNAYLFGDAHIGGEAVVGGNARIGVGAIVESTKDWICAGPVGNENSTITAYRTGDGWGIIGGCSESHPFDLEAPSNFDPFEDDYPPNTLSIAMERQATIAYLRSVCRIRQEMS